MAVRGCGLSADADARAPARGTAGATGRRIDQADDRRGRAPSHRAEPGSRRRQARNRRGGGTRERGTECLPARVRLVVRPVEHRRALLESAQWHGRRIRDIGSVLIGRRPTAAQVGRHVQRLVGCDAHGHQQPVLDVRTEPAVGPPGRVFPTDPQGSKDGYRAPPEHRRAAKPEECRGSGPRGQPRRRRRR